MKVACVIPARQWSVGRPGKNRVNFDAALTCAQGVATAGVFVSTDDPLLWHETGYTLIKRPSDLEDGDLELVIAHAVADVLADVVVVLQPSSPSTNRAAYAHAAVLMLMDDPDATSVVTVVPWEGEPPEKAVYRKDGYLAIPPPKRRQDCRRAYRRDGTVYAVRMNYAKGGDLYGPRPVPLLVTPHDSVTLD